MYETFFGLKRRPFLSVPDTEHFFPTGTMNEIRQTAEQTIRRGSVPLIFGSAGTGKTLLLRLLRQPLEKDYSVSLVANGHLETPKAFFQQLLYSLGLPFSNADETELRIQLIDFALDTAVRKKQHGIVLLIDEAQFLSVSVFETVRQLLDCGDDPEPLFRAALAGTSELEEKLTDPALEGFQQRVVSRLYLENFSREETAQYITRQLRKKNEENKKKEKEEQDDSLPLAERRLDAPHVKNCGNGSNEDLFSFTALTLVHHLTDGLPRLVNQLCDTSLQLAAERVVRQVDEVLIQSAWARLQQIEKPVGEPEMTFPVTVKQSEEELNEIVARKKETLQLKMFDSAVEFGTLEEEEIIREDAPVQEELIQETVRSTDEKCLRNEELLPFPAAKEYKPAYPLDDDEEQETEISAQIRETRDENHGAELESEEPEEKIVPVFQFKRRGQLLRPVAKRYSPFRLNFSSSNIILPMDKETLERYGAEVLGGHPPFVRREPHYVYQTTQSAAGTETLNKEMIGYPDPSTGRMVVLNWCNAEQKDGSGFGTAYSDYEQKSSVSEPRILNADSPISPTACTALSDSLDEPFEETIAVPKSIVSIEQLYRTVADSVLLLQKSDTKPNVFAVPDDSLPGYCQQQLDTVLRRLVRAAEKIEQAADVSENAGQHLQQTAEYIETEVQTTLPAYTDLFQELTEFHKNLSAEIEQLRTGTEHRSKPERRILQIDRSSKATIDARTLFQ